jgi:predicted butyrate kinase (DUF1464 family)
MCLAPRGEPGGIGGLAFLLRALAKTPLPIVAIPGVVHLPSVPAHRKINRVDMGTADKVCAAALAIQQHAQRHGCREEDVSLVVLELGGAFTAALAIDEGRIVDGLGGSSGPLGAAAAGALDAEVAFLAERVSKEMVFSGGALAAAGAPDAPAEALLTPETPASRVAWNAYVESAAKAVASLIVSAPAARSVLLSGRLARSRVRDALASALANVVDGVSVDVLTGFAAVAKHAAQGAALLADGLAGGRSAALVERLGIRAAEGTVLDHLLVVSRDAARRRLGI